MGHTSSALALDVYAKKMERGRDTGVRMDALLQEPVWARKARTALPERSRFRERKRKSPLSRDFEMGGAWSRTSDLLTCKARG